MNEGTIKRTALRALTTAGVVIAVWNYVFDAVYEKTGEMAISAVVATVVSLIVVAVDAYTTYMNQDYTEQGDIGTSVTRQLKEDPTLIVDVHDGGAEDEDEETMEDDSDDNSKDTEE